MRVCLPKPKTLLYWGFLLMIFKTFLSDTIIIPYSPLMDNILSYFTAGILAIYILLKRYSVKILLAYMLITLIVLYSTIVSGQYGFLISIIAILALRDADITAAVKFIYNWELLLFISIIILSIFCGFFSDDYIYGNYYGQIRFHFGFAHPNMLSIYLFNLIIMWIWLNFENMKLIHVGAIVCIEIVSYIFTKTRTSLLDVLFLLVFILFIKRFPGRKIEKIFAGVLIPFLSLLFYLTSSFYTSGNVFLIFLDNVLSGRIRLGSYAFEHFGLTFLGQNIEGIQVVWDPIWRLNGFTFDCTYTYLMMNMGILWLIIISIGFIFLAKKGSDKILVMIIAWGLYAITEVHGINGFKCFPILLLAYAFFSKHMKEVKKYD